MTEQPTPLFDADPPDGNLTDRQTYVLELLRRTEGGLQADEVGAQLHSRAGKHGGGVRCKWCTPSGREVLAALRKKGLVVRRRSGDWQALAGQHVSEPLSAQTDVIPF